MDDAEFEAALAAQVASVEEQETPTEETGPESPAEVTAEAEVEPEQDEGEDQIAPPAYPDEVQSFLDKYDGDVDKALKAAVHAQSKIGEQGAEIGELRRMVQEISDRPEPKAPTSPYVPQDLQAAIEDNPGQVAQWALQNEQPQAYEAALTEWYDTDPKAASRFEITLNRELLKQELQSQIAPEIETVRERENARAMSDAHKSLASRYQDFQQVLETATTEETAGLDRNLLAAVMKDNPAAAMETVYRWVKSGRGQQEVAQSAQRTEEVRQQKRDAAVVTTEATNTTPEPTTMDRLKEFMLAPDPHSVSAGLKR